MASITRRETQKGTSYLIQTNFYDNNLCKKVRKSKTWIAPADVSESEALKLVKKVADQFEEEIKENISYGLSERDYTIESYSKVYIEYLKKNFSPTNYSNAIPVFDYLNRKIGSLKLQKLNPTMIQNYFDEVDKEKRILDLVFPVKSFKSNLELYGYNYQILRRKLNIQHFTLGRAFKGESVAKAWADILCEKTKISFDELFVYKRVVKEYSFITKKKRKIYLRQLLAFAKRQRIIKENYATADFVIYSKEKDGKEIQAMDEEQAKKFYEALLVYPDIRIKTALLLFLLTGFRRGEVAGLKWQDIDFVKNKISVKRTAIEVKKVGIIIKEPKTHKSTRTITMPEILSKQLQEYKAWQDAKIKDLGDYYQNEDWLFTQPNGKLSSPGIYLIWLHKILDQTELPLFSIHSLRHTNITLQITAGVPLITVSGRAGHSRTSTTTDIYSHFIQTSDDVAAKKINQMFTKTEDIEDNDLLEYKRVKEQMEKLGLNSIKEYMEYLEFKKQKEKIIIYT